MGADNKPNNKPYKKGPLYRREHSWDEAFGYFGAAHAMALNAKQAYGIKKEDIKLQCQWRWSGT